VVETHDRQDLLSKVGGLEVVPPRQVSYRGVSLEEMDLDALLDRRPAVVLVDELAHSDVPGCRFEKRRDSTSGPITRLTVARVDRRVCREVWSA
jgi:two-component system sensor histidine kinase KdpD